MNTANVKRSFTKRDFFVLDKFIHFFFEFFLNLQTFEMGFF